MLVAVCEDDKEERQEICGYIEAFCQKNGYACDLRSFDRGEALLGGTEEGFDLVFLDIYLPGMSGIDTARALRARMPGCVLVLVTVSTQHALEGYEVEAVTYVVKPLSAEKMDKALALVRRVFDEHSRIIRVPAQGGPLELPLLEIRYVEVYDKAALFHLPGGTVTARIPLDEVERELGGAPFLRCHRSYIVNLTYVTGIEEERFLLREGDAVPIRRRARRNLKLEAARFLSAHGRRERL